MVNSANYNLKESVYRSGMLEESSLPSYNSAHDESEESPHKKLNYKPIRELKKPCDELAKRFKKLSEIYLMLDSGKESSSQDKDVVKLDSARKLKKPCDELAKKFKKIPEIYLTLESGKESSSENNDFLRLKSGTKF